MARYEVESPVTLSVFDRLIDENPKQAGEPPLSRAESLRLLKIALKRDLEWLLNTRRNPDELPPGLKEAERSFYNYGLPDITSIGLSAVQEQNKLKRALEKTVSQFEPRIAASRIVMEVLPTTNRGIRFHIQGLLRVDPSPVPVAFDTVLELPNCNYSVKGE